MQTKSIIQANANVIRIVNLKKGDIYKRIDDSSSYNSDELKYGVIQQVYNDGEKTFIESIEYTKSYGEIKAEVEIFTGTKDISIYPVELSEIEKHFANAMKLLEDNLEEKKKEVYQIEKSIKSGKQFISGELSKKLSVVKYKELSQSEYEKQKKVKVDRIKELNS